MGLKTTADGPQDWDVAIVLTFKNWAALDAFATKGDSVSKSYYGSYDKRSEAGAKRSEFGTVTPASSSGTSPYERCRASQSND